MGGGGRYGRPVKQWVRFCTGADGVRLAYAGHGERFSTCPGRDLAQSSRARLEQLKRLGERHTVIRYDERGCGLSDANIGDPSVDVWVGDLETVIDAAGLERFALLGVSQAAAIAVAYAARHPDRLSDLVLCGGYARGRRFHSQDEEEDAIIAAIRAGWTTPNPAFRRVFSMLFVPITNGAVDNDPLARVFTGPRGGRITTAVLRDATHWDEVVTHLGYEHLRRHDLRHTGLTWMADAGVPVHVLRKIAGHGSLVTTQRYLHPDAQSIADAGAALSAHLTANWSPNGPQLRLVQGSRRWTAQT